MHYMHICNGIFVAVSYFSHRLQALFYNIYDKSCMQINAHSLTEYIYFYFYSILFFFLVYVYIQLQKCSRSMPQEEEVGISK